jgi:2-oxoglutarate/2-oxoacid ferredoxin oxidoreductase subunit alpha
LEENEVRFENIHTDDADYLFVAYGSSARICQKAVDLGREKGIKVGLLRPITLFPFPKAELKRLSKQVKGILSVEMSLGQMVEDIQLTVGCDQKVRHFGRVGGIIHSPEQVLEAMENLIIGG